MSIDASLLPSELKAIVDKAVAEALAANAPPPPKQLTPAEQAALYLANAEAAERADHTIPTGSGAVHSALFALLHLLVEKVYPAEVAEAATPSPVVVTAESVS